MMVSTIRVISTLLFCLGGGTHGLWTSFSSSSSEDQKTQDTAHRRTVLEHNDDGSVGYGVDVSFPMHYNSVSTNYEWLTHNQDASVSVPKEYQDMVVQPLGNRQAFYEEFMEGCEKHYTKNGKRTGKCWSTEHDRIAMSLRQPQSMQVRTLSMSPPTPSWDHVLVCVVPIKYTFICMFPYLG